MKSFFYIFLFFSLNLFSQEVDSVRISSGVKIIFGGDLMSHGPQLRAAYNDSTRTYDYKENFTYLSSLFHKHDMVVINLETVLGVKPYSGYPAFSAPPALAVAAKKAGINMFVTANNHSCDKGKKGIIKTLDILDRLQLMHTGTFRNKKEKDSLYPYITEVNGIKIAWLNYTYGTNGISTPFPTKVNRIDKKQIAVDVAKAKSLNPDVIIAFMHWGEQYQNKSNKVQQSLINYFHSLGVRYIIGSHPHVIQEIDRPVEEKAEDFLSVYSLGNFLSNQRRFPRDGSVLVSVEFIKNQEGVSIKNMKVIPIWVYKYVEDGKRHYEILPVEDFMYNPDYFIQNEDYQKMMKYYKHFLSYEFDKLSKK
jgi:poly-gamma-glutamate synthesis protein (capsule biosynthesis protein)